MPLPKGRGSGGGDNPFNPDLITQLKPAAWFRFGVGITVTGAGVSTWADQSGNGRDLLQGTDTNRPALQADSSILFDGVDNFLKCSAFTFNQPYTVYILGKQITWADSDRIFSGNAVNTMDLHQSSGGVSPQVSLSAGSGAANNGEWALNVYAAVASVFNGASSSLRVNNTAATTGDAGAGNAGGFELGADSGGTARWSNIQVKEVILFSGAHNTATQDRVINYLSSLL